MNSKQCYKHLVQWSLERGGECPVCILERALRSILAGISDEDDPAFFSSVPSKRDVKLIEDAMNALESVMGEGALPEPPRQ